MVILGPECILENGILMEQISLKQCTMFLIGMCVAVTQVIAEAKLPMPANDEWHFMSFEQRHSAMTFLIHPSMMERFQQHDETVAPELTCESCHGAGAESAGYEMANTELLSLDPNRVRHLYLDDADLTDEQLFKRDNITPAMARLMGVSPYDPQTGLGFSCFGCHPREE